MSLKIPVLAAAVVALGAGGMTLTQPTRAKASSYSIATKGGPSYTTYYSELAKDGYAKRSEKNIDFTKSPAPYFNPVWTKKTKAKLIRGKEMATSYDGGPSFSANGNQGTFYRLSSNPAIRYTYVGTFRGKKVDMIIQMKGFAGEKLKDTVTGTHVSYKNQAVVFMNNKFGFATPKVANHGAKAYVNKTTHSVPMNNLPSKADLTIRIVNHGTNTNVKADADHTIGLGYMEMEPAFMRTGGHRYYSLGQRVMTYDTPVQVGNYTTKAGKSNIDREFGKWGVLKLKDDSSFPKSYFADKAYTDFDGPRTKNSALAVYKTSSIGISWRGHAPQTDLLDISGMKLPQKKAPKQPAPKKYVGPQSGNMKTYKATKSALLNYEKTFAWKIVQKTKKAKFSGKG